MYLNRFSAAGNKKGDFRLLTRYCYIVILLTRDIFLFPVFPCAGDNEGLCGSCKKGIRVLEEVPFSSAVFPTGFLLVQSNSCSYFSKEWFHFSAHVQAMTYNPIKSGLMTFKCLPESFEAMLLIYQKWSIGCKQKDRAFQKRLTPLNLSG